ncbi:hypothetical protein FQN54_008353 [Arachnomyces sp. PD_36]|nr:hypothetical protein FQN54_008353 [Arachnomyces sp. PD_36]
MAREYHSSRRYLPSIPNEIILEIANYLNPMDLNSLIQTSSKFSQLLTHRLYDLALTYTRGGDFSVVDWAASAGQPSVLEKLVDRSPDIINIKDEYGTTALHRAVWARDEAATRLLLDFGADPMLRSDGRTVLHEAAILGLEDTVKLSIEAGASVNTHCRYKETPLSDAVGRKRVAMVRLLIDAGADVNVECGRVGNSPLHHAAEWGSLEMTRLLLEAGADKTAVNVSGETPLLRATWVRSEDVIRLLRDSKEESDQMAQIVSDAFRAALN